MNPSSFLFTDNGTAVGLSGVPRLPVTEFRSALLEALTDEHCRLSAFFAMPEKDGFLLIAVLLDSAGHRLAITSAETGKNYPALTPENPAFHWFEREIAEQYGIQPEGHPWLKPIRFQSHDSEPGVTDYFRMKGDEVHEVAVGPIHAGVIEPGHFRFQCMGETVYHLEIELGYQHRGVENLLAGPLTCRTVPMAGTIAGDSTAAHTVTFCRALESLAGITCDPDSLRVRAVALELERIANHIGDLGALAGDVAYLPAASFCGRIRGDYLNLTAELCGNRFGRNLIVPGGVAFALDKDRIERIRQKLLTVYPELKSALNLMFDSPTVLDRLENTGMVSGETLRAIGAVGVAARAGGLRVDARRDLPCAEYGEHPPLPAFKPHSGDVMARAQVRYDEIKASHDWLFHTLPDSVSAKCCRNAVHKLAAEKIAVSVTEGWRGEICHVLITGSEGSLRRVKIVDPSFRNWFALALALRNGQISDFPICNKSFNLSYCGHDL